MTTSHPQRLEPDDPGYPTLLRGVAPAPSLQVLGTLVPDDALALAVVGSRRASEYGLEVAARLAGDLAARGVTIVSGLARGIDAAAHRGALEAGGRTIAVLGSGIDRIYPPENRALARRIEAQGAVVSQFPSAMPPLAHHFPARNRTIVGLALGVVVVEAAERSGALITARLAGDLGREVFAIPGRITSETSRGSNGLIQDGAKLVRDWQDVVQELPEPWRRAVSDNVTTSPGEEPPGAETDAGRVFAVLNPDEPLQIEQLIVRARLGPARAAAALVALEVEGWARPLAGQRWVACGARGRRG